jgi:TPR repeat protein
MRRFLFPFLIAATFGGAALADPLDEATAAYNRGDYAAAVRLLEQLANDGNRSAQYNLGMMYIQGKGVPQNLAEGAEWYRRAAVQGDVEAERNLGSMYQHGIGVPEDNAEAAKWYLNAAERGDAIAQFELGLMYARGEGMRSNYVEAYKWFILARASFPEQDVESRDKAVTNRNALIGVMTAAQIAEAQKRAREWTRTK